MCAGSSSHADAPAGVPRDAEGDDLVVHVLSAVGLPQPRPSASAHVQVLCGTHAVRTHNARLRADGAARWDAVALLPGRASAGSGRQTVTLCVLTGGRDPLLLGQTTITVQCVTHLVVEPVTRTYARWSHSVPLCLSPLRRRVRLANSPDRAHPPYTVTLHDWRTGRSVGVCTRRCPGLLCGLPRPDSPPVALLSGTLRVALYPGTCASGAPELPPVTLLRGSGELVDDGHASVVSDVACTLRALQLPLPSEPVTWRLTTRGLVFHAAMSEQEQEAAHVGGGGGGGQQAREGREQAPRLCVGWDATARLVPVGDAGVAACKPSGMAGRDVVLRCEGGTGQRNKLLHLATAVRTAATRGGQQAQQTQGGVQLVSVAIPHVVRTKLPPRQRIVARAPLVGSHVYAGRVPSAGSLNIEVSPPPGNGGSAETVTISGAALASFSGGAFARVGSATSPSGAVRLQYVTTSALSAIARWRLNATCALCVAAAVGVGTTSGYPPHIMDTLFLCLLLVAAFTRVMTWQPRRVARHVPGAHGGWTIQVLGVHMKQQPAGLPSAAQTDDGDSSDAASDAGDDDDGPPLSRVEFLPDGSIHPLWSRYVYVWGDTGKEPPPVASLGVPGRLPDALARVKFRACLRWRREAHMDEVLLRPQPHFHLFKRLYPHAFHGQSRSGAVIFMEKAHYVRTLAVGLAAAGASPQNGAHHIVSTLEYLSSVLDPRPLPGGRAVRIVDASGVSFGDVAAGEVLKLLRTAAQLLSPFFPERIEKLVILNAPPGFALLFSFVSQFMSKRTQARVVVIDAGNDAKRRQVLHELVDPSQLPVQYDGTCTCAGDGGCWRQHPLERQLWAAVEKVTPPELRKGV